MDKHIFIKMYYLCNMEFNIIENKIFNKKTAHK